MDRNNGFTLIEVLISLALFSMALVALIHVHVTLLQANQVSYQYSVAYAQITNLAEMLQATPAAGAIDPLLADWNQQNAQLLPNGEGVLQNLGTYYTMILSWEGPAGSPYAVCVTQDFEYCVVGTAVG